MTTKPDQAMNKIESEVLSYELIAIRLNREIMTSEIVIVGTIIVANSIENKWLTAICLLLALANLMNIVGSRKQLRNVEKIVANWGE